MTVSPAAHSNLAFNVACSTHGLSQFLPRRRKFLKVDASFIQSSDTLGCLLFAIIFLSTASLLPIPIAAQVLCTWRLIVFLVLGAALTFPVAGFPNISALMFLTLKVISIHSGRRIIVLPRLQQAWSMTQIIILFGGGASEEKRQQVGMLALAASWLVCSLNLQGFQRQIWPSSVECRKRRKM